jgi:hypothetical protein
MGQKTTLVGESFAPWVKDQVEARQNLLGRRAGQRYTSNELRYMNGKTAFLRLVSGVDIDDVPGPSNTKRLQDLGLDDGFLGNELARHFVLEGGTSIIKSEDRTTLRGGLVNSLNTADTSLNSKGVYGLASSAEYGYTPMPGLIDAEIKSLNRGSLKEATVKIKCWNPRQFDIIDTLFIKLKYGMLLEWGHSIYVDNNGEIQNNNFSLAEEFLSATPAPEVTDVNSNQQAIYRSIEKYREDSNGNYDAILAYVKNFNWTLNPDNSYDIELSLISIGDVIESLKCDISLGGNKLLSIGDYDTSEQSDAEFTLIKHANRSLLDQIFGGIYQTTEFIDDAPKAYFDVEGNLLRRETSGTNTSLGTSTNDSPDATRIKINTLKDIVDDPINQFFASFPTSLRKGLANFQPQVGPNDPNLAIPEAFRLEFADVTEDQEEGYYIKLGTLLRTIESAFVPQENLAGDNPEPMFRINHTFQTDIAKGSDLERVALCYTMPLQVSLDPSVCLVPLPEDLDGIQDILEEDVIKKIMKADPLKSRADAIEYLKENVDADEPWYTLSFGSDSQEIVDNFEDAAKEAKDFNKFIGTQFRRSDSKYIGNMNHIHVSMAYVSDIFTKLINKTDKPQGVNIYDFLTQIMDGIGKALGGINDFEVVYDSDINFFYIIDNTQLPDGPKIAKELNEEPVEFLINLNDPIAGRGSFVTDTSIKSEISSELAAEISIAAVSPGKPSQNANSSRFEWINYGTENRILRATEVTNAKSETTPTSEDELENILENYASTCQNFAFYLKQVANQYYDIDNAADQVNAVRAVLALASQTVENTQADDPTKEGTQSRGFIPINLSITLDGLSGPKIYEKFKIPNAYLPSSYRGNVNFLIKEITHTIGDGKWDTSFGSLCVPFTSEEEVTTYTKTPHTSNNSSQQNSAVNTDPTPTQDSDDYRSLSSGLPHGRPPYPVEGYRYAQGGSERNAGDGYTIFNKTERRKTQIILHHTAGHAGQGPEGTIATAQQWASRTDQVSTHTVISFDGYVDILFPDEYYGNNTGASYNLRTLGIEIQSLGWCYQDGSVVRADASKDILPPYLGDNIGYIEAVDKFGNPKPYKNHQYYQAYTTAQIEATITTTLNWIRKHNIPFSYDYDILFPGITGADFDNSKKIWKSGTPGVYTHNSMRPDKSDIFPQREILVALRNLALQLKQEGRQDCNGDVTDYGSNYPNGYNL